MVRKTIFLIEIFKIYVGNDQIRSTFSKISQDYRYDGRLAFFDTKSVNNFPEISLN